MNEKTSSGPPAPSAGGAIFERLGRLGVDAVFVNSGTDFPPIIEGLAEAAAHEAALPRAIVVAHEHVAMGMAHGWYFATGRAQAVILHTNVGLANGVIGAINAATDHVPVVIMSGRTPTVERDRFGARTVPIGWGQEMRDQAALVRETCKWDYELRFPEQVPEVLDRAYAIAESTPPGPVYLSLPREVLCEPCPRSELDRPRSMTASRVTASDAELASAAEMIANARRPLIISQRGAGSLEAFAELARVCREWAIPVCQYWAVATAISSDHPMNVGADPEPWISEADVILVLDSLAPWSPDVHRPHRDCRVIHLGPNPLYSRHPVRNFRADLAITSELGPGVVGLARALDAHRVGDPPSATTTEQRRQVVDQRVEQIRTRLTEAATPPDGKSMTKASVAAGLGEAIKGRRATVLSELGCPLDHLGLTEHDSFRQEPHSGGLGWSLPCGLGMKLADPERLIVATMGDGSFMFANPVACLQVAEAHDIAVLALIVNNGGYGAVRHSVLDLYPTGYASKADDVPLTSLAPSPDFAMVARACRAHGETVVEAAELPGALERALRAVTIDERSAVLDVHVTG